MDLQLTDKLCVVTASTGGIGLAIAKLLAKNGAFAVVNGRSDQSTRAAMQQISQEFGTDKVHGVAGDLSSADGVQRFIEDVKIIEEHVGRPVDVLVNNLGMFHNQEFAEIPDDKWIEYYETNTMSGVRLSRHFLPKMLERNNFGRIVFISSEGALKPLPNTLPYCVSKTSQLSLSRGLAELTKGTNNVTVNAVLPGPAMTQGVHDYIRSWAADHGFGNDTKAAARDYFQRFEPTSLLQRFLDPEEVAYATVMLCSPLASGINGVAQHVDGGIVRHIS